MAPPLKRPSPGQDPRWWAVRELDRERQRQGLSLRQLAALTIGRPAPSIRAVETWASAIGRLLSGRHARFVDPFALDTVAGALGYEFELVPRNTADPAAPRPRRRPRRRGPKQVNKGATKQ